VEALLKEGCHVKAFCLYNSFNSWGWIDSFPDETKNKLEVFHGRYPGCIWSKDSHGKIVKWCFHLAA
jgi:hypothetical protein